MIEYFTIKNFLSKDDCEKIVEFSKNNLSLNDAKIGNGIYDIIKRKSDRKSTRLNSSHVSESRMPSSA